MRPTVLPTPQSAADLTRQYQEDSPQIRMMEQDFAKERDKLNRAAQRQMDSLGRPASEPSFGPGPSSPTPPVQP